MSTPGIIEAISHAISEPQPEAMLAGMHESLGIDPEGIRSGMPEAPAVTLYYTGGQFHAFWYDGLSEIHRARLQDHIDAHHKLGDLRALEGFYWVESLTSGQPHLDHLDELKDFDLEARTIRWTLNHYLGQGIVDLLAQPEAAEALAGIARREHIDIAIACAWAARSWPHPAWISCPNQETWRNLSAELEEMPSPEAQTDGKDAYTLHNHYFGEVRFCLALPGSQVPDSLEMLFAEDAPPALEMPLTELLLPDFAEDFGDVSLDMLFAEALPENAEPVDLEVLFGDFSEAVPLDKTSESISLESLFAEQPPAPEGLSAEPLVSLFGTPLALEESLFATSAEPSLESLFGEAESLEIVQPIVKSEMPVLETQLVAEPSLESLFDELESLEIPQLPTIKSEMPGTEAKPEAELTLEDLFASEEAALFGEAPSISSPEELFAEEESTSSEPPAPQHNFISLMAGQPQGAAIFASALPLACKLEWICAESPEVLHGLLADHLAHLECRVLYCPPQQMSRPELQASLQGLPSHLPLKVGFGLPEGHSLFVLTDAENNRLFYHQLPTEVPAVLVESWSSEKAATEIDWRQERFEMLWENRLYPHIHVESLSEN